MKRATLHITLSIVTSTDWKKTGVVFWAASNIQKPDQYYYGYSIDQLFNQFIKPLHITKVYVHDDDYVMSYIYNYLLENNYVLDENMDTEKLNYDPGSYNLFVINGGKNNVT